ncbi:MAG: ribulose-phosphate 3-epimerase [Candidatus Calescibacterium sp.]|nr:ribulose-phosphate 3-epimerase [Candidatus Calescibacterium sp.]MDW8132169.1 ribulose-phosphate 3-epimerase [Candidatus Calescibacterium sp.]
MFIAGSIIGGNILNIEEILKVSEENGVDWIHLDIMDGNFVPNITFGLEFVKKIKQKTFLPLDVHLMVLNPDKYVEFSNYCDMINFHIETTHFPIRVIEIMRKSNPRIKVGVAVNPCTSISFIENMEGYLDNILIMSVEPGFAGQKFINNTLKKIEQAKKITENWKSKPIISVDGGINSENYKIVLGKGANYIVCASYLYDDYSKIREKILMMRKGL